MKLGSLFAGIGGFDLGLEWAGFTPAWQVEKDEFCQKVLKKHWPDVVRYGDIYEFIEKAKQGQVEAVDIIAGGFPCQPFSQAGVRKGISDDRYLWPAMLEVISIFRPAWIIGENVAGIVRMALDQVFSDLENEGYACQSFIIPACAVNAPHRRDRVWIIANNIGGGCQQKRERRGLEAVGARGENNAMSPEKPNCHASNSESQRERSGLQGHGFKLDRAEQGRNIEQCSQEITSNTCNQGLQGYQQQNLSGERRRQQGGTVTKCNNTWDEPWIKAAAKLCVVDDGISGGLVRPRGWRVNALKAAGNAVVPQIPYIIGKAIIKTEYRNYAQGEIKGVTMPMDGTQS